MLVQLRILRNEVPSGTKRTIGFKRGEGKIVRREGNEDQQGGVFHSQAEMHHEVNDSVELAPLGSPGEWGSRACAQSRHRPDPSYPIRAVCSFSMGQPRTGGLARGAHGRFNRISETNAITLTLGHEFRPSLQVSRLRLIQCHRLIHANFSPEQEFDFVFGQ